MGVVFYLLSHRDARRERVFYPIANIPCRVVIYGADERLFDEIAKVAEERVRELERIFNPNREESEVSRLNRGHSGEWHTVGRELQGLTSKALEWYGKTGGAFDITVLPLIRLWEAASKEGRLPTSEELKETLEKVGASSLIISEKRGIMFQKDGMEITFGGIAKGYIADELGRLIEGYGVHKYIAGCGGDLIMKGKRSFRVGVQDPKRSRGELMAVLEMPEGAVSTSGNYERFYEIGGKRYSHIIDPKSGMPVENGIISVTILGKDPIGADALATGITVLGVEDGVELLKKMPAFMGIIVKEEGKDLKIYYSKGLEGLITYNDMWNDVDKLPF